MAKDKEIVKHIIMAALLPVFIFCVTGCGIIQTDLYDYTIDESSAEGADGEGNQQTDFRLDVIGSGYEYLEAALGEDTCFVFGRTVDGEIKYGLLDKVGDEIIGPDFDKCTYAEDDYVVFVSRDGKTGPYSSFVFDEELKLILEYSHDRLYISNMDDGMCTLKGTYNNWPVKAYLDINGDRQLIEPYKDKTVYGYGSDFYEGHAIIAALDKDEVAYEYQYFLMDREGKYSLITMTKKSNYADIPVVIKWDRSNYDSFPVMGKDGWVYFSYEDNYAEYLWFTDEDPQSGFYNVFTHEIAVPDGDISSFRLDNGMLATSYSGYAVEKQSDGEYGLTAGYYLYDLNKKEYVYGDRGFKKIDLSGLYSSEDGFIRLLISDNETILRRPGETYNQGAPAYKYEKLSSFVGGYAIAGRAGQHYIIDSRFEEKSGEFTSSFMEMLGKTDKYVYFDAYNANTEGELEKGYTLYRITREKPPQTDKNQEAVTEDEE